MHLWPERLGEALLVTGVPVLRPVAQFLLDRARCSWRMLFDPDPFAPPSSFHARRVLASGSACCNGNAWARRKSTDRPLPTLPLRMRAPLSSGRFIEGPAVRHDGPGCVPASEIRASAHCFGAPLRCCPVADYGRELLPVCITAAIASSSPPPPLSPITPLSRTPACASRILHCGARSSRGEPHDRNVQSR